MESIKHKLVMAFLTLCLIAVAVAIWYMIAIMPNGTEREGTLVKAIPRLERMVS